MIPLHPTYLVTLATALLVAPFAHAHTDGGVDGTPKTYCEDPAEWNVHDYAVGAGFLLWRPRDGNVGDCNREPKPLDYDGHMEYATGGAWLLACDEACGPGGTGDGADDCFGEPAHHPEYPTVGAWDALLGSGVTIYIAADHDWFWDPVSGLGCGDGEEDESAEGTGSVAVTFPAGTDGSYRVYVQGTLGHVFT